MCVCVCERERECVCVCVESWVVVVRISIGSKLGDPFVSQNPIEFYESPYLGWILVCAYTIW